MQMRIVSYPNEGRSFECSCTRVSERAARGIVTWRCVTWSDGAEIARGCVERAILTPKRNWRQCLCKIFGWQTKSFMVCYGISEVVNSRAFCLKSPRDWTRWLISLPPWIGECRRQSGTTFSEGMDLWNTLPPLKQIWITNSWASMRSSLLWAELCPIHTL